MDKSVTSADLQQQSKSEYDRQREEFFEQMRAAAERANLSEEEGEKLVAEAIEAVRAERRRARNCGS